MTFKTMRKLYRMVEREIDMQKRIFKQYNEEVIEMRKKSASCWDETPEIEEYKRFIEEAGEKIMELKEMMEDMENHMI